MELQRSSFVQEDIEALGMGAGILPYSINPDGELHLLLGRERYLPLFRGSCRWSGFEGGRKDGESVDEAAMREFQEESLQVVTSDAASLLSGHTLKVVLRIANDRKKERYHCSYVCSIPWDAGLPASFQATRMALEQIDRLATELRMTRPACLETSGDILEVTELDDDRIRVRRVLQGIPSILRHPWTIEADGMVIGTFEARDARCLREWSAVRDRLQRALFAHPALTVRRTDSFVQEVLLQKDYLEKDQVRWWSESRLRAVMSGHGQLGNERFRPYFLPVLQTVLAELPRTLSNPPTPSPALPAWRDQSSAWHAARRCEPCLPNGPSPPRADREDGRSRTT